MNPSAPGWIPKFISLYKKQGLIDGYIDENQYYIHLKSTGFLYGVSIKALPKDPVSKLKITTDEYTKINLFHTLLFTFFNKNPKASFEDAIDSIIHFYKLLEKDKISLLNKLSLSQSPSSNLEYILSSRLQDSNGILKKRSTSIITYALLFLDILSFRKFLVSPNYLKRFTQDLENTIINCCFLALKAKKKKDKYDLQLIELYESSTDYMLETDKRFTKISLENLKEIYNYDDYENEYILDLCSLAVWDDRKLDDSEYDFLKKLNQLLGFERDKIDHSIQSLIEFSEIHSEKIKLFNYSNPLNQLYKQSTAMVKLLVRRNRKRLLKEMEESGELVMLLGQSTLRELDSEEKSKVKEQLLDICKTVPSLTIFLVPGGSLLLPLLVKYIPSILPSSFQENRIDTKKK
jgi:hypothetical protein